MNKRNINYHWQDDRNLLQCASQGNLAGVERALNNGANVNTKDNLEHSALHLACVNGYTGIARRLLKANADVSAKDKHQNTALHVAAFSGHAEIVKLLIDAGSDLNALNMIGETPLHGAMIYERDEIINLLLQAGADVDVKNIGSQSVRDLSQRTETNAVKKHLSKEFQRNLKRKPVQLKKRTPRTPK